MSGSGSPSFFNRSDGAVPRQKLGLVAKRTSEIDMAMQLTLKMTF